MMDLALRRRFFAEEIETVANLRTPSLVEALASVPREQFLRPGPWLIVSEGALGVPRPTPDADPRHVYHSVAIGIDPSRQLFNGGPATVSQAIDALRLTPGEHVVHLGCGLGYYTALMAHCVGPAGRVTAIEIDAALAEDAKRNLAPWPWVEVRCGDGSTGVGESCDAILVNAGVTHPRNEWLDGVSVRGRIVLPLTVALPQMGTIGKGLLLLLTPADAGAWAVRVLTFVAIYSALGLRDDALNQAIGAALGRHPMPPLSRLRREPHEATPSCWLHAPTFCLSTEALPKG
jgi:protein-L-isoaspartate(D-aspartate) O-methyltransferase